MADQVKALGSNRRRIVLAAVGVGMLTFGCRLWIAEGQVSWNLFLDQWATEMAGVIVPLAHGKLVLGDMVASTNEHRVLLTRALSLSVIISNGSWDNRIFVIVNFLLESFAVAWVCCLAWSFLGWARGSCVCAAALLPMLLVCDWETIISSNESQFVFMALGSVVALSLMQGYSLRSLGSWGALVISVLMLGSMASGFLTALTLIAVALIAGMARVPSRRFFAGFCGACMAIAALGWLTRVPFPSLYSIYAKSVGEWLNAFFAYAAWPLPPNVLGCLGMWLPWCVLLGRTLWRRELRPLTPFALGLGIWVLLQACALAWTRAGLSGLVSSRYTEFLGWGLTANATALALVFSSPKPILRGPLVSWTILLIWLAGVGGCEIWRSHTVYRPYLETFRNQTLEHEQRLGTFMRTGDPSVIESVSFPHIPYEADQIISALRDPRVQPFLPAPLRRDLVRDREPSLLPSVQDGPLSFVAIQTFRYGPWLAAAGAAMLLAVFLDARIHGRTSGTGKISDAAVQPGANGD